MGKNCRLIAIVGPTASGKTSLANKLAGRLGKGQAVVISQDQYYKDWSRFSFKQREKINFDNPSAFDFALMKRQLSQLKRGNSILVPLYSYKLHQRIKRKIKISLQKCTIVEGLLVLHRNDLNSLFDLKIYVDVDEATSLARRIKRDLQHRAETVDSVCTRYFQNVLPMQKKYVEPQKKWADIVVDGSKQFDGRLISKLVNKCNG